MGGRGSSDSRLRGFVVKARVYIPWLYLTRYPFLYIIAFLMMLAETSSPSNREKQWSGPNVLIYGHLGTVVVCATFLVFQYKPRLFSLILAIEQPLANYALLSYHSTLSSQSSKSPPAVSDWQRLHSSCRLVLQFASYLLMASGYANYPARRSIHPRVRHIAVCAHGIYLVSLTFILLNDPTLRSALLHSLAVLLPAEEHGDVLCTVWGLFLGGAAAFYLSGHPNKLLSTFTLALVLPVYLCCWNIPLWQSHYGAPYWFCIRNILDDCCFLACLSFYMFMFR